MDLTPPESLLLKVFLEYRGRVISHRELALEIKQEEVSEKRAPEIMRSMISRLLKNWMCFQVRNVRETGYVFDPQQNQ